MAQDITRDSPIEVALAFHDPRGTYSANAGVTMTSIFEHTMHPVRVHILHDATLTDDNRTKFQLTAEKYNQQVEFHDLTEHVKTLGDGMLKLAKKFPAWSLGMFFRLFLPEVVNTNRIIYMDCDVLANLDIRELWEIDLKGNCLGGVLDFTERERSKTFGIRAFCAARLGICLRNYINTGVLLMDLQKIRERPSMLSVIPEWIVRYRHLAIFPDQDFLNAFFSGAILFLPEKFNTMRAIQGYDRDKPAIAHLTGSKPWAYLIGQSQEIDYWQTYMKSAWGKDEDIIEILVHKASLNPRNHQHTPQCWKHVIFCFFRDITHDLNKSLTLLWLVIRDSYVRLKYYFRRKKQESSKI